MPVITGTLQEPYEVLDSIFAYEMGKPDLVDYDINNAFVSVKNKLRDACRAIGGNAVISCQFEYRDVFEFGFGGIGETYSVCLLAYGTAVLSSVLYNNAVVNYQDQCFSLAIDSENCVLCPICGDRLRLDAGELSSHYFECTNCNNEINFELIEPQK